MMQPLWASVFLALIFIPAYRGSPFLLFANRKDIRLVDVSRPKGNTTTIVKDVEDAAVLDYHFRQGKVCWTDISLEMIKCADMVGNVAVREYDVITTGIISPDGLACDWLNHKMYWTDSETNRLEVAEMDGSNRKVLFWEKLDQPRAIALVPFHGLMFWTDWGEKPKIERAGMNGDSDTRKVIVNKNIVWPNGLTIDYEESTLFWADANLHEISSVDFNGENRYVVVEGDLPHPFALTQLKDTLFWTDWNTRGIHSCNKYNGTSRKSVPLVGSFLSPMDIDVYSEERQPMRKTPCQINNGGCSHLCLASPTSRRYSCACPTGVSLLDDDHTCANGSSELLLLARRTDLRRISLDTPDYTDVVLPLRGVKHAIAVDFDPIDRMLYWTDDEVRAIRRAYLDGSNQENILVTEVYHPDGLAVDWIARNLYWTDTGTDRIEVARLNGTSRKVLLTAQLDEPRAIALDPEGGYMYWTDWGRRPKIERAFLDGTHRSVLINTDLGWPNGIALDFEADKFYWCDAKTDKIEVANLDGSDRRELLADHAPHIFGFSLLGDYIYWTDWQHRSIERIKKNNGSERVVIIDQLPDLMGLKAVNVSQKIGWNVCADHNGGCSHLCLNRPHPYKALCDCPISWELARDEKTCVVPEAFLLFTRRQDIRRISLEAHHNHMVIPVSGIREASALDFHIQDQRVYWTDINVKTVNRAFMNGSSLEKIVEFGLKFPEGMAVDWVARNIYWADTGLHRIEIARLDGSSRRVIVWKRIHEPRSLALDPGEGYMYWSDWGYTNTRIERAAMDGTQRTSIINKVGRANGLTIDFTEGRLYWTDLDHRRIESASLNGKHRRAILTENLPQPYCLTQYEDYVYWADWKSRSIERANKRTGLNHSRVRADLDYVMDLLVFHASRQSGWNPCAVNNGGCSHLCLAMPSNRGNRHSYKTVCGCPAHYTLKDDNISCNAPKKFLIMAQKNVLSRIVKDGTRSEATDMVLPIPGLKQVRSIAWDPVNSMVYWIDGRADAIKRARENGTDSSIFISHQLGLTRPYDLVLDPFAQVLYWSCSRNDVVNVTRLDGKNMGVVVGGEGQKPRSLALHLRTGLLFWTNMGGNSAVIQRSSADGSNHSTVVTDLQEPTAIAVDQDDQLLFWADSGSQMIEYSTLDGSNRRKLIGGIVCIAIAVQGRWLYWLDKEQQNMVRVFKRNGQEKEDVMGHMMQLSDLISIEAPPSSTVRTHPCRPGNHECSHLCLKNAGVSKCSCPLGLVLLEDGATCGQPPHCHANELPCRSQCLPMRYRCDGEAHCPDYSDELNCPTCPPNKFRCFNGQCIDGKLECDGSPDCLDLSDERCCKDDQFRCHSSRSCISTAQLCDGHQDCRDGADEIHKVCHLRHTPDTELKSSYSNYLMLVSVILGVAGLMVLGGVLYYCRRRDPAMPEDMALDDTRDRHLKVGLLNPATGERIVGADGTLQRSGATVAAAPQACPSHPRGCPFKKGSCPSERQVTGASSTSSSSGPGLFPLNPPPSPASQWALSHCQYYHHHYYPHAPPTTPCSTDVNGEDSDRWQYDSDPYAPPPTPRSHYHSDSPSCPPSPNSTVPSFKRSYPPPPAPSPIQEPS